MTISPELQKLIDQVSAKRARTVIDHILKHGQVTTEELEKNYGYKHAPRGARDVRECGIPLKTIRVKSSDGRSIAAYTFDALSSIKHGRIGGRKAFSKRFKEKLIAKLGQRDSITGQFVEGRYLQIDHRIPYAIAGDGDDHNSLEAHMLLDNSSQRAKSFSCENCDNLKNKQDINICATCYWAYPENYTHVAMEQIRRADIEWRGEEVEIYQAFQKRATISGDHITTELKKTLAASLKQNPAFSTDKDSHK